MTVWGRPPERLSRPAAEDEVHVWRALLVQPDDTVGRLRRFLSLDEQHRATAYRFERDQRRFIVARGVLRILLGRYLGVRPVDIVFRYTALGKPALASCDWRFNLAHSHEVAVYAIARRREVGIDVERIRSDIAIESIAERYFSQIEATTLLSLPLADQRDAFFACWTRKEAYLKGRGDGLTFGLDQFDVSLSPGLPPRLLATRGPVDDASRWTMAAFDAGSRYIGALVAEGGPVRIRYWDWDERMSARS
jgi:4'-phosphopantetheinyl transferase